MLFVIVCKVLAPLFMHVINLIILLVLACDKQEPDREPSEDTNIDNCLKETPRLYL